MMQSHPRRRETAALARTALASALALCFSSAAFAAPGKPSLSAWDITSKPYGFVQIDLTKADGGHPYKDVVRLNKTVEVPLKFDIWSNGNAVKAMALIDGVVDGTSEIRLTPNGQGTQQGTVNAHPSSAGVKRVQVRACDANGACTDSDPLNVTVFDSTPALADPLPNNVDPNNQKYANTSGSVVGTYFATWSIYDRNYDVSNVPVENLTHILYGFVPICGGEGINDSLAKDMPQSYATLKKACAGTPDFNVVVFDAWGEIGKALPGQSADSKIKGVMGQMMAAKKRNPNLKVLPSIGGWTMSDPFFHFGDAAKRKVFVDSVEQFLRTWKFFDGVDIDWEFPGGKGANPSLGNPATDGATYVALMKDLRAMLDKLSKEYGRTYELTSAIGAGPDKISVVDYKNATQYMDYIFDMTYDYYGAWSMTDLGHQTALYAPKWKPDTANTTDNSIKALLAQGVDPSKLVVGVAKYGRGWTGVSGYRDGNPFTGTATGPIKGGWEPGILDYKKIVADMAGPDGKGINGYTYVYDEAAEAPYLFNKSTGALITYDDARSTQAKGRYALDKRLGGLFSWEIDSDNGDILNAMHEGLGHRTGGEPVNRPPVANAGGDLTVQGGQAVVLDGSRSSDPDGDALTFGWEQVGGDKLALSDANRAKASVTVPVVSKDTQYRFRLTVSDPKGLSRSSDMTLTVKAKQEEVKPPANRPPLARISGPASVDAQASASLSAAGSSDPDGDKLTFAWQVPAGVTAQPNGATLNFAAPNVAKDTAYTFKVTVSDGKASTTASHTVTVKAKQEVKPPANRPPLARISGPASVDALAPVHLSAADSSDPEGDKLTFTWHVPAGINAERNGDALSFTAPDAARDTRYTFEVTVSDGKASAKASHTLTVKGRGDNGGGGDNGDNGGNGGQYPAYQPGTAYKGGEIVSNNGKLYQCKPFPYAGWCGQAPAAYEPGKGWAWTDAWIAK